LRLEAQAAIRSDGRCVRRREPHTLRLRPCSRPIRCREFASAFVRRAHPWRRGRARNSGLRVVRRTPFCYWLRRRSAAIPSKRPSRAPRQDRRLVPDCPPLVRTPAVLRTPERLGFWNRKACRPHWATMRPNCAARLNGFVDIGLVRCPCTSARALFIPARAKRPTARKYNNHARNYGLFL